MSAWRSGGSASSSGVATRRKRVPVAASRRARCSSSAMRRSWSGASIVGASSAAGTRALSCELRERPGPRSSPKSRRTKSRITSGRVRARCSASGPGPSSTTRSKRPVARAFSATSRPATASRPGKAGSSSALISRTRLTRPPRSVGRTTSQRWPISSSGPISMAARFGSSSSGRGPRLWPSRAPVKWPGPTEASSTRDPRRAAWQAVARAAALLSSEL